MPFRWASELGAQMHGTLDHYATSRRSRSGGVSSSMTLAMDETRDNLGPTRSNERVTPTSFGEVSRR